MRRFGRFFKRLFSPPAGTPTWLRLIPLVIAIAGVTLLAYGGVEAWNYTNSSEFCGTTCHTMPPEYSAYLRSPHARVKCVECHIGRDVITTQITRKAGDLRHVVLTLTQDYEFPIHSRAMRPARESCETCHFPQKFSDDSLRQLRHFDEQGQRDIFLLMKTGGGAKREGLGRGIHWHIENEVYYLPTDSLEQNIPYVRTVDEDGTVTEYYDIAADFGPEDVAGQRLEKMDCITCHNRITHAMPDPQEAVDLALAKGLLSQEVPELRVKAVAALSHPYTEQEEALREIEGLEAYYRENYPDDYAGMAEEIALAQRTLFEAYASMVFPEQKIDWTTHPNNLGHEDSPGCFRCHDGKHLTGTEEAIRLECNLCHSIPEVTDGNQLVTELKVVRGPEPASHTHTSWITLHGKVLDSSCAACHVPPDANFNYTRLDGQQPEPDDQSFCGNSACHGPNWNYTGFDAPELQPVLARQAYILQHTSPYLLENVPRTFDATFRALLEGRCTFCHSGANAEGGLDLSTYAGLMAGGEGGPAVVPGEPEASLLIQRQSGPNPHFGQVLPQELEALHAWIAAGAPR